MENNNKYVKYLAILALLLSVAGLSLGFAAFTNTISITASGDVTPDANQYHAGELSVDPDTPTDGTVTPSVTGTGATADPATLTESGIENISVHFTGTNQSADYTFYGINTSPWTAYLNTVTFGTKTCSPKAGGGATAAYVEDACDFINMTITVGADEYTDTDADIDGHAVADGTSETIVVHIEYIDGAPVVDGPFDVDFGTSTITYSSAD